MILFASVSALLDWYMKVCLPLCLTLACISGFVSALPLIPYLSDHLTHCLFIDFDSALAMVLLHLLLLNEDFIRTCILFSLFHDAGLLLLLLFFTFSIFEMRLNRIYYII